MIDFCGFQDLGFTGIPFTWDNRQDDQANVKVRLGRFLTNQEFLNMYEATRVRHIPSPRSDHCLVSARIIKLHADEGRGPHRFVYEDAWQREESHMQAVSDGWMHGTEDFSLTDLNTNLIHMQSHLTEWKSKKFGDVCRKLKKNRKEFEKGKNNSMYKGSSPREKELARQLNELLLREEIMARQRSRVGWLWAGDRNTGFFHSQSTARRTRNRITALENA